MMNNKKIIIYMSLITLTISGLFTYQVITNKKNNTNLEEISVSPNPTTCIIAGCNGELCVDSNTDSSASICLYKEEFQCYKYATCELQNNDKCGWTYSNKFTTCKKQFTVDTFNLIKPENK